MPSLNQIMLIGHLGQDPKKSTSQNGNEISQFSIATTKTYKGEKQTVWHNVVCFKSAASFCNKYLFKGDAVFIEGEVEAGTYEKNGESKYFYKVIAHRVQGLKSKATEQKNELPNFDEDKNLPF